MNPNACRFCLFPLLLATAFVQADAQVPALLNTQGRVVMNGTNFTGTGQFKFALMDRTGLVTLWSSGGSPVSLSVVRGLYSALLGDTNIANMATLQPSIFTNTHVLLRVWFDGGAGLERLVPDQRIASVGYALAAHGLNNDFWTLNGGTVTDETSQVHSNVLLLSTAEGWKIVFTPEGQVHAVGELSTEKSVYANGDIDAGGGLSCQSNLSVEGSVNCGSNLTVRGGIDFGGDLFAGGDLDCQSNLTVSSGGSLAVHGNTTLHGRLTLNDDLDAGGSISCFNLTASGNVNGSQVNAVNVHASGAMYATSFNTTSDRNAKERVAPVDSDEVLARLLRLPVAHWSFKADAGVRHIGPMAQDFRASFGVGDDDRHIALVDQGGVAFAAIQGLNRKLEQQLAARDAQVQDLQRQLDELRETVRQLSGLQMRGTP
jgi:hypothetical protein